MAAIPIVDIRDKRVGIIVAILVMLALFLYLWLTTFIKLDPPPQDIPVHVAEPLDVTEILQPTIEGGSGGGQPSDDPVHEPQPQTEQILTQQTNPDTQVNTGEANTTNAANSTNQPTSTQESDNPFADGGSGDGAGGGTGGTFGGDSGTGTGGHGGSGGGKGRTRLNNVSIDLHYNTDEKIYLKLLIDAEGNVLQAYNIKGKTTTTDGLLINDVIQAVKKQVKYNKDPGSAPVYVFYTVRIDAQ